MVRRWLAANKECEERGDWTPLASMYTADATYGWNMGPGEEFMVAGRDKAGDLSDGMRRRMERAASDEKLPGHHRLGHGPVPLW